MIPSTREVLADLVAFDTTSARSNLELIAYVEAFLTRYGIAHWRAPSPDGSKAGLWATLGPEGNGGLILSGHSDCVPCTGQSWSSDPYALVERDGRLYARGAADMKGFVASALTTLARKAQADRGTPLHLALSYDEELGCSGVGTLLDAVRRRGIRPAACLVGEPTSMQPVIGHKGGNGYRCTVTGFEAHSSLAPQGVNAIEYAAEIIACIRRVARDLAAGPSDSAFDIPTCTISTGLIEGGTAVNIVPNHCSFTFEFRNLIEVDPATILAPITRFVRETVEPAIQAISPAASVTFEPVFAYPAHALADDAPILARLRLLLPGTGVSKVAYGTEAGLFQRDLGVPTIICGPGAIAQAHKPNEYVATAQLEACDAFLDALT